MDIRRTWRVSVSAAAGLLASGACFQARALTLDFESPIYVGGKTIDSVDGWQKSASLGGGDNFKAYSESAGPSSANKWVRIAAAGTATVFRDMPANAGTLDLQWRWRGNETGINVCLGISGSVADARNAARALVCLEPNGGISALEALNKKSYASSAWIPGAVHFMRIRIDVPGNAYSVYMAGDSLRADEKPVFEGLKPAGLAMSGLTRLVLRSEDGLGSADVDDIAWEPVAVWKGADADSNASNPKNWSTGVAPDSQTQVVFSPAFKRGCFLDKAATVRSVAVEKGWTGTLDVGASTLTVMGRADFIGLARYAAAGGGIRLAAPKAQSLTGPEAGLMPALLHDSPGLVRLDGKPLFAVAFAQTAGSLDLNGMDILLATYFIIRNGNRASVTGLDGRSISAGKSAYLEGTQASPLTLKSAAKGWNISITDTLLARFAEIGNSSAGSRAGLAVQCLNLGGNANWVFANQPAILASPADASVLVGQTAVFKVKAGSALPMTFQWLLNDQPIAGAVDSIYVKAGAALADNLGAYSCTATNSLGSATSAIARLRVSFPAPAIQPQPRAFSDSLAVKLLPPVTGAALFASRNQGAFLPTAGDLVLKDSTYLQAYAVFGADTSAPGAWIFPKLLAPRAEPPDIFPDASTFSDTLLVSMAPVTAGSRIYYTVDQSDPDTTKTLFDGKPIVIRSSTLVRAVAAKAGYRVSDVRSRAYTKGIPGSLAKPDADPQGGPFADSVRVRLIPPASAPAASVWYRVNGGSVAPFTAPFLLLQTAVVKAFAVLGSGVSDTASWTFTRRLEAPVMTPKGRNYPDTLRVSLAAKAADAVIRYTLDGRDPDTSSPRYTGPLLLDSTVVIKAVAAAPGQPLSAIQTEAYSLVPNPPAASPRGGDFPAGITVQLSSSSRRATIYYTLDGTAPGPAAGAARKYESPFRLDTNATVKAVAVAGQGGAFRAGEAMVEAYTFFLPGPRILGPGQHLDLSAHYSLISPLAGAQPVQVTVLPPDSLKLAGFRDVLFGMQLSLAPDATAFPVVRFASPAGEERMLYSLSPGGAVRHISSADTAVLPATGTYFLGTDTLPPVITLNGESFVAGDSSRALFTVQDNVSNLVLALDRNDDPSRCFSGREIGNPELLPVVMKAPAGSLAALALRLRVDDHRQERRFPADSAARYFLAQRTGPARSPAVLKVGSQSDRPWDLVSVPFELDPKSPKLTLAQLRENNTAPGLAAKTWDAAAGKYRDIKDDEPLSPGQAVWLGSPSSLGSLAFPALQTAGRQGQETYKLRLRKGWNLIGNPSPAVLHWPVTRVNADAYAVSRIKGLNGFDPALPGAGYFNTDSLVPWKGYFVLYGGTQDTLVSLLSTPPSTVGGIAKRGRPAAGRLSLSIALDRLPLLRLGAAAFAADGVGIEDEPLPPSRADEAPALWSARESSRLGTDLVRWDAAALMRWRIVAVAAAESNADVTMASARVEEWDLPEGYSAFAVSRSRGLKFPLVPGGAIPMQPGRPDTLDVFAGPRESLAARLSSVPENAGAFRAEAVAVPGGFSLRLASPEATALRWGLWSASGRLLDGASLALAPGLYDLGMRGRSGGPLPGGLYLLKAEWRSASRTGSLARKFILP